MEEFISEIKDSQGDRKILEKAEEIEKRSIKFYTDTAKKVNTTSYKEVFNVLIKEEKGHLELVRQMADYMVVHGVWSGLENYFANE